jgi:hypothetical protein
VLPDGCRSGVDALHRNVDVAGGDTGEGARQLVVGGEGLLGDVEGAVNDASDVDLEDGEPEGPGSGAR